MTDLDPNNNACVPVFKALADETRLSILHMLQDGELCACKIQERFDISQPTLSYHMKILTQSGLVKSRKDGLWMRYSLIAENFCEARDLLARFSSSTARKSICLCADQEVCPPAEPDMGSSNR